MSLAPGHADALLADRRRRWRAGQRILTEDYFALNPAIRQDRHLAVRFIHQEYQLLWESGGEPRANEFLRRFPEFASGLAACLSILPARVDGGGDAPGPHFAGRFVLRRPLGESERGVVYKAFDLRRRQKVAVKVLRLRRDDLTSAALAALRRDLPIAADLRHPNLCRLHGLRCGRGEPYLVRDYVRGLSLADWLKKREKARDIRRAVTLVWKVARGLAAIHDVGLIHRNVKPANVLLDAACEPRLTDPELIPVPRPRPRRTRAGSSAYYALNHTPGIAYLAPEQTPEYAAPVGPSADVYSLGVVMHHLITGMLPDGNPPLFHRPDLDPVLEGILKHALARRPQDRFPAGRDLAAALGTWLKRRTFR